MAVSMKNIRYMGWMSTPRRLRWPSPDRGGEIRDMGIVPNRPEAVRKLVTKLSAADRLKACYEAGPPATGCTGS
jgi:transposase